MNQDFYNLREYLCTYVQLQLEEAEKLFLLPSEDSEPFKFKYQSRDLLQKLLNDPALQLKQDSDVAVIILNAIIHFHIGQNYFETEENSAAEKSYIESLKTFQKIPERILALFLNYLQILYNSLGILYTNRDDIKYGLGLFAKAEHAYELILKLHHSKKADTVHTKDELSKNLSQKPNYPVVFKFFFQGGLNLVACERNYTLTLFYMAQAYTKINLKEKAAKYCGDTLKRQFKNKEFELKDWCSNCISLADYYISHAEFAQAQYLLMSALHVIPQNKKKKLQASLNMSLGRHLLEFLKYSIEKYQLGHSEEKAFADRINKKLIIFEGIGVDFVFLKLPKNTEEIATVFRQMNTQFKKALKVFVLDGYVSENIQIARDLSTAYRCLAAIEKDTERQFALHEKRRELLELPQKEINPKAYENYWQHLTVELAEINNTLFDIKWEQFSHSEKPKIKKSFIQNMNNLCFQCIKYYEALIVNLMEQKMEQKDFEELHNTIITAKFNVAKSYSRIQTDDRKEKVGYLAKSLESYKWIKKFIQEKVAPKGVLSFEMRETLKSCEEMTEMLPTKIDKVNVGEF